MFNQAHSIAITHFGTSAALAGATSDFTSDRTADLASHVTSHVTSDAEVHLPSHDACTEEKYVRARSTCARRLRDLYALLFNACGRSHRAAQRRLGRDVRGLIAARDYPSLDCVIQLSTALGVAPGTAVELLTSEIRETTTPHDGWQRLHVRRWPRQDEVAALSLIASEILCADLDDDPTALAALVERIPLSHDALRGAVFTRISVMRGSARCEIHGEHEHHVAKHVQVPHPLARVLAHASNVERALATVWCFDPAITSRAVDGCDISDLASFNDASSMDLCDLETNQTLMIRTSFFRESTTVLKAAQSSGLIGSRCSHPMQALSLLEAMTRRLESESLRSSPMAFAWAASTVGLTALFLLRAAHSEVAQQSTDDPSIRRVEASLRRAFIKASFILDELTRCGDARAERLACARRSRLILAEQAVRAADGEDVLSRADAHDWRELHAAMTRFPDAGGFIQHFRDQTTFSQLAHFAIDASLADRRMRALVPIHASRVAAAWSRSESRC